jgi:hypothetical protein
MPIREITRQTGLSRNTVRKYLASGVMEPSYPKRKSLSKLDDYELTLTSWLCQIPFYVFAYSLPILARALGDLRDRRPFLMHFMNHKQFPILYYDAGLVDADVQQPSWHRVHTTTDLLLRRKLGVPLGYLGVALQASQEC